MSRPDARLSATRWLVRASKPQAPISGTRSVIEDGVGPESLEACSRAWSTASRAMTRYVVSLPPATSTRPGTGLATVCSRESLVVSPISPSLRIGLSSGRSPAQTPITSRWSSGSLSSRLTWPRR